jgi:hypothetical protein
MKRVYQPFTSTPMRVWHLTQICKCWRYLVVVVSRRLTSNREVQAAVVLGRTGKGGLNDCSLLQ